MVEVVYINSATNTFMDLQSGFARPYWEVNITVSGDASTYSGTLGQAYSVNNKILSMSPLDRERPVMASGLASMIAGDMTISLNNINGTYSPMATASIFTDAGGSAMDYFNSIINVWAGFEDVSGTAFAIKRGSFLLTKISIDSKNQVANLYCEDAAKTPLQKYIGLPGLSGTAIPFEVGGGQTTKTIMTEILSGIGLTAAQYDLITGSTYTDFIIENEKASDTLGKLAQRAEGFMATDNQGRVVFAPNVNAGSTVKVVLKDSDRIKNLKYEINLQNIINKVQTTYNSGADTRAAEDATVTKGRQHLITNDIVETPAIANAIASRVLGQYKIPRYLVELDNIWLPSLDVRDQISIYDANTFQTAIIYEIYRIRDDIVNCSTKIYAINDITFSKKFGYASNTGSEVTGGIDFTGSWHDNFAFACAENTGFDNDGDNNDMIDTGLSVSGAGGTGIESPFEVQ